MNRKLNSLRIKKLKLEEKIKEMQEKYKQLCDDEVAMENEHILSVFRKNNISLDDLLKAIERQKNERKENFNHRHDFNKNNKFNGGNK